jgi:hypothetical protein
MGLRRWYKFIAIFNYIWSELFIEKYGLNFIRRISAAWSMAFFIAGKSLLFRKQMA